MLTFFPTIPTGFTLIGTHCNDDLAAADIGHINYYLLISKPRIASHLTLLNKFDIFTQPNVGVCRAHEIHLFARYR